MSIFGDGDIYESEDLLNDNIVNTNVHQSDEEVEKDDDENAEGADGENKQEGDEAQKVEAKKRSRRSLRTNINTDMLMGPRGIQTIENHFTDMKFRGKGREREDLNDVMKRLEHWSHRLFPRYGFDDNLEAIERLGRKKIVQVHMTKYRRNMLIEQEIRDDVSDEEVNVAEPFDEMDALLDQQIEKSKHDTTHNSSVRSFGGPGGSRDLDDFNSIINSPRPSVSRMSFHSLYDDVVPLPNSPRPQSVADSPAPAPSKLTAEQMALIAENRLKAQQRLQERRNQILQQQQIDHQNED